ncbi:hypothetical protein PG991_010299 [Apiospora marii]|uniref:Uncharacterized protein n=1 Tax=Apiospora marii TaxID=335849 RepID=A0ABR1RI17_9PEZI
MDLLSIVRFSRVSIQANGYVRSCHEYRDILRFVPDAVKALRRLGIHGQHTVANLYDVLRAEECAICGEAGPFLFLPTCQRCCNGCRKQYPSLRLMDRADAKKYCGLTKEQADSLPTVHVRKAMVHDNGQAWWGELPIHGRAVAAQAARNLGLAVHGSEAQAEQAVLRGCAGEKARDYARFWTGAHRGRPRPDWYRDGDDDGGVSLSSLRGGLWDKRVTLCAYSTMATMPFPVLTRDGTLEHARWCLGCQRTNNAFRNWRNHHFTTLSAATEASMRASIPPEYRGQEYRPSKVLFGLTQRAWSRRGFAQHVRDCPGAQRLLEERS